MRKEYCVLSGEMDCPTEGDEERCEICDRHDTDTFDEAFVPHCEDGIHTIEEILLLEVSKVTKLL